MDSAFPAALAQPLVYICVVSGIGFFLLSVAPTLLGREVVKPDRQLHAALLGGILITIGLFVGLSADTDDVVSASAVTSDPGTAETERDIVEIVRQIDALERERELARLKADPAKGEPTPAQQQRQRQWAQDLETLKTARAEAEQRLLEQRRLGALKEQIIDFYNNRSTWHGVFSIERIEAIRLNGLEAHVKYKFVPIQGNSHNRRDIGWDTRVFKLRKTANGFEVVNMGAHQSGSL